MGSAILFFLTRMDFFFFFFISYFCGCFNWAVIVFGNLFVCLMEGLIVGIQVLRLEYYEIFSRFYQGGGTEFRPYRHKTK